MDRYMAEGNAMIYQGYIHGRKQCHDLSWINTWQKVMPGPIMDTYMAEGIAMIYHGGYMAEGIAIYHGTYMAESNAMIHT